MSIEIREGFLGPDEIDALLDAAHTLKTWDNSAQGYWQGRIAHANQLADGSVRDLLVDIRKRVRAEIMAAYGLTEPIYSDTLQIVRWPEGFEQQPHADAQNPDGSPHPYAWRSHASIIYLNDDFEGGRIYFPIQDLMPPIRPGMLAFFPGTLDYLHGVSKVTRGVRFTVASFWTADAQRKDTLPID